MRSMKKLGVLVAVFALSAIGAASASAASFTASVVGTDLERVSNTAQVFTTDSGTVTCNTVAVTGKTAASQATAQHATVHYTGCNAFGFPVHISPATYEFTAGDTGGAQNVHIKSNITLKVTVPFFSCHITVPPQTVGTVDYSSSGGHILLDANVTGIDYVGSGGLCGSGTNGTYEGNTTVKAKSGTLGYHH